jgi:soluble lytic murein transglycosylase-like protein
LHLEDLRNRCRRVFAAPLRVLAAALLTVLVAEPAAAQDTVSPGSVICQIIERNAAEHGLPIEYLSRLLWVESGFDANATSPAGAAGIAQFMPETAAERGLRDARDPPASITHAPLGCWSI